jgi:predicted transcriptional regulator
MENQNPVLEKIRAMVAEKDSQVEVAKILEISPSYLNDILKEKRMISASIAAKFGFFREMHYVHIPVLGTLTGKGDEIGELLNKED